MKKIMIIVGLLLIPCVVDAFNSYKTSFNTRYGTTGTRLDTCFPLVRLPNRPIII